MWDFVGDMLTPDAIAAERAASAAAMREACAKACEAERDEQQDAAGVAPHIKEPHAFAAAGAEICRVVIEALPLPSASALAAMIEAERARLARLVEAMVAERKQTGERVVLAIAARNVRRGRFLTDAEKVANLHKAMKEADDEAAFHAGAGEGGAS
ncbi:hypothetical protein GXW78_27585 [Roseomonas terrae]|uniref:Uncharacterized protein n=2 Tax=Neoroseomonas terrae TaxID=424799 RepID=A0ABS5EQY8_9PROT|nr:hypothetical protein [Neoroseomonas terrae]